MFVDDIIIIGNSNYLIMSLVSHLNSTFAQKQLPQLDYFLSIEVHHTPTGFVLLTQNKYICDLLHKTDMAVEKSIYSPMVTNLNSLMPCVGFPQQLLFGPIFLYTIMFKGNMVCRKAHRVIKYLKLKRMNPSIKLRELVLDRVKFKNKALLKENIGN